MNQNILTNFDYVLRKKLGTWFIAGNISVAIRRHWPLKASDLTLRFSALELHEIKTSHRSEVEHVIILGNLKTIQNYCNSLKKKSTFENHTGNS